MPLYLVGFAVAVAVAVVRLVVVLTLVLLRPLFETAHPDFFSESPQRLRS